MRNAKILTNGILYIGQPLLVKQSTSHMVLTFHDISTAVQIVNKSQNKFGNNVVFPFKGRGFEKTKIV